jgi:hypothetical protein
MRFRKLRIAWSVFWGLVAVLLIVLWVRSYSLISHNASPILIDWDLDGDHELSASNLNGRVYLSHRHINPYPEGKFLVLENPITFLTLPYWFLVFTSAAFGTLPWLIQRRLSCRTLLIAMTLVATALGLIVWLSH